MKIYECNLYTVIKLCWVPNVLETRLHESNHRALSLALNSMNKSLSDRSVKKLWFIFGNLIQSLTLMIEEALKQKKKDLSVNGLISSIKVSLILFLRSSSETCISSST